VRGGQVVAVAGHSPWIRSVTRAAAATSRDEYSGMRDGSI
jgi:hypothetical protein